MYDREKKSCFYSLVTNKEENVVQSMINPNNELGYKGEKEEDRVMVQNCIKLHGSQKKN